MNTPGPDSPWVDSQRWPLLLVTLPKVHTDEDVAFYLKTLKHYREKAEPYGLIIDTNRSSGFTAKQRRMQANHISSGLPESMLWLKGAAFIADTAINRGMLTAVFWLQPPPCPYVILADKEEGLRWVQNRLDRAPGRPPRQN